MRPICIPAACALLALTACGAGEGGAGVEARDSAGVRIVEVAGLPDAPVGWSVGPQPVTVIGGDTEDERAQLLRVTGAAVRSDGRIVVADGGSGQVRLFERDGRPAGSFGRKGGGPGEFRMMSFAALLPGDSLLVHDALQRRITVVTPELSLGRTFDIPASMFPVALLPGGPVVARGPSRGDAPATGVSDGAAQHFLVGLDGAVEDSIGVLPRRSMYMVLGEGSIQLVSVPFSPVTTFATTGDRLHVGTAQRYEILTFDAGGDLRRILRAAMPAREVTPEEVARWVDDAVARVPEQAQPGQRRLYEDVPPPEEKPAHGALLPDGAGHLWVERYGGSDDEASTWSVFDGEGTPLGTVTTPAGVEVLEVGEDYLLGTGRDELDRVYVAVWDLDRGGR